MKRILSLALCVQLSAPLALLPQQYCQEPSTAPCHLGGASSRTSFNACWDAPLRIRRWPYAKKPTGSARTVRPSDPLISLTAGSTFSVPTRKEPYSYTEANTDLTALEAANGLICDWRRASTSSPWEWATSSPGCLDGVIPKLALAYTTLTPLDSACNDDPAKVTAQQCPSVMLHGALNSLADAAAICAMDFRTGRGCSAALEQNYVGDALGRSAPPNFTTAMYENMQVLARALQRQLLPFQGTPDLSTPGLRKFEPVAVQPGTNSTWHYYGRKIPALQLPSATPLRVGDLVSFGSFMRLFQNAENFDELASLKQGVHVKITVPAGRQLFARGLPEPSAAPKEMRMAMTVPWGQVFQVEKVTVTSREYGFKELELEVVVVPLAGAQPWAPWVPCIGGASSAQQCRDSICKDSPPFQSRFEPDATKVFAQYFRADDTDTLEWPPSTGGGCCLCSLQS